MFKNARLFSLFFLLAGFLGSSLLAEPDVGWTDTGKNSYLQVEPNAEWTRFTFVIQGAPIQGIALPAHQYSFQDLRDFIRINGYAFANPNIGREIDYMLGEDNQELGNGIVSQFASVPWLTEFLNMLNAFDAHERGHRARQRGCDGVLDIYPFC